MSERDLILQSLAGIHTCVITAHDRPDGDALGASLGLCRILRDRGVRCTLAGCEPVPERYAFLLESDRYLNAQNAFADRPEALVVLDTALADRSSPARTAAQAGIRIINIDHHASNTCFGAINWVEEHCGSSAEMVAELAREADWTVSKSAAEALYAGVITDTGRFCYENTTPASLRCGAWLVERGVEPYRMNRLLYETLPETELRLNGRAIASLRRYAEGKIAVVSLSREDYAEFGCGPEMSGEAINLPRRIEGVRVALFFYEPPAEVHTKISVRTEAPLDAVALVQGFGGGGHARAAGASFAGRIPEAEREVLAAVDRLWGRSL